MTAPDPQPTLAAFLLARYKAEAEAWGGATGLVTQPQFAKLARGVLADVAAKKKIVDSCSYLVRWNEALPGPASTTGVTATDLAGQTLRLLAQPYADHSDFRAEWAL